MISEFSKRSLKPVLVFVLESAYVVPGIAQTETLHSILVDLVRFQLPLGQMSRRFLEAKNVSHFYNKYGFFML